MLLPAAHSPVRDTPPASQPVTLDEAKAHLRLDGADEDLLVAALVEAATTYLDGWSGILGRCLITQGWSQKLDCWPASRLIRLPFPSCSAAVITYRDEAGSAQTLSASLHSQPFGTDLGSVIMLWDDADLPALEDRPAAITVSFSAGYGAAADIPRAIRAAILIMVADLFQHRGSTQPGTVTTVKTSATVDALLAPFRRIGF